MSRYFLLDIPLEYTTWHHLTEKSALISIEITSDICLLLSTSGKTRKTQDMEKSGLDKLIDNMDVTVEYDIFTSERRQAERVNGWYLASFSSS